ncbi:enoyl-CoA hydratase-related protein [Pseudomonas fluorescens]|uniref:Fatty acid oxidation complex subunit alpha n=1 Tax=Pseudomonas fluorescens TaxID=294 RepID=A0A5E7EE76_PSEFL|nr:enoyl-CoA hydratase-related protein [Pseudomonas fluorescens]VVO24443.1 Fatty acid oxidation complex subunit alpha [Pseudomonas fluorescens]
MSSPVQWSREGAIAVVRIDNPPVNALGQSVRAGLLAAFNAAEQDPQVKLVLLYCAGRTFIAGADIREFGKPAQAPILPDVTRSLESFNKPSLAVLHGSVLGGGLEVALACHYRIIQHTAKVGLPEVKLGLLPGAGGTQRLPRLVGVAQALEMIVGAEPISAVEAKRSGIVDELYDGEPLAAGLAYAAQLLAQGVQPRRSGQARVPAAVGTSNAELLMAKRAEVQRGQPGLFSPLRCIAAIEAATTLPLIDGLQRERALFLECLESPQRAALIYKFFAERQAAKAVDLDASVTVGNRLVEEGVSVAQVDAALREFGMAMGPFAMLDMPGLKLDAVVREPSLAVQVESDPQRLWQRPIYALINEGARILEEGIALRASDIDVISLTGYGFPAHRGGPMFLADQIGLPAVLQQIREFHQKHGEHWKPAPLLERLVAEGKTFAEQDQQG